MGFKLFLLLEKFLIILPKSFRKAFFLMLASLAYRVSKRHRTISYQNLDFAFDGKLSEKEKDDITRYAFKNLAFNFLHALELRHMSINELKNKITIDNIDAVARYADEVKSREFPQEIHTY